MMNELSQCPDGSRALFFPPGSQHQQHITHTVSQRASAITETLNTRDHLHKTT